MIAKKFYRMPEPKPPTFSRETTMRVAHKLLQSAGERWVTGAASSIWTQLVYTRWDEVFTQREFEHKVIFTYEMTVPT